MFEQAFGIDGSRRAAFRLLLIAALLGLFNTGCGTRPEDRASAEVLIKRAPPGLLGDAQPEPEAKFSVFRETQAKLIKSPFVFTAALRDKEVSALPMIREAAHPIEFLDQQIEVDNPATEFLRISFRGPPTQEAALIVNAVTNAYLQEVGNNQAQDNVKRAKDLEKAHNEMADQLRVRKNIFNRLTKNLQTSDPAALTERQKMMAELTALLRRELAQAKFRLMSDSARLALLPDAREEQEEEPPAAALEAELQRQLDHDSVSAALVARRLVVQSLLEEGAGDEASREQETRLEPELPAIEKALVDRREELRRSASAALARESRERHATRRTELEQAIATHKALIDECEQELKRNEREVADPTNWTLEIEALKEEIDQFKKFDQRITEEMTRLKVESNADQQRVVLYRSAEEGTRTEPLVSSPVLVGCSVLAFGALLTVGLVIWQRASRKHWVLSANDCRAAVELFERLTRDIDRSHALQWDYLVTDVPEHRVDELAGIARKMAFTVEQQIDPEKRGYSRLTLSEHRVHTVSTFIDRLAEVERFAKSHELELSDCSAGR